MEDRKYHVRLSEKKETRKSIKSFMFKPTIAIWTMFAFGLALLFTPLWLLGILILILVGAVVFLIPNRKVLDIYEDGILIYDRNEQDIAQDIRFNIIKEWKIQSGKASGVMLILLLEDDYYACCEVNNSTKLVSILNGLIPEKEANYIRLKEMEKLKTPFSFDVFKRKNK